MQQIRRALLLVLWPCLLGCPSAKQAEPPIPSAKTGDVQPPNSPLPTVRLVVIDDPAMAETIEREWQALSMAPLAVENVSESAWLQRIRSASFSGQVDAVVYPSRLLGEMVERQLLVPLPARLESSEKFAAADLFPLVRREEITWGKSTYAVPLGCPQFVLAYPASLAGDDPPDLPTWDALDVWLNDLPDTTTLALPTAEGWASELFLARAASYVSTTGQVSALFDFRTMQPFIDRPPFVKALAALVQLVNTHKAKLNLTPGDVCDAVLTESAIGILWWGPGARHGDSEANSKLQFHELPGSHEVFSFNSRMWQDRRDGQDPQVPLTGLAGRLGSVVKSSRRQRVAWNLLLQISGTELGYRTSAASSQTAPYRASQLEEASLWTPAALDATAARAYADTVRDSLAHHTSLSSLRLPSQEAYREALDSAVRESLAGNVTAQEALTGVAESWTEITKSLGVDQQKSAYCRSLGIDP